MYLKTYDWLYFSVGKYVTTEVEDRWGVGRRREVWETETGVIPVLWTGVWRTERLRFYSIRSLCEGTDVSPGGDPRHHGTSREKVVTGRTQHVFANLHRQEEVVVFPSRVSRHETYRESTWTHKTYVIRASFTMKDGTHLRKLSRTNLVSWVIWTRRKGREIDGGPERLKFFRRSGY